MSRVDTRRIGPTEYCIYCGEVAKEGFEGSYHNNDFEHFYTCECDTAQEISRLQGQIRDISHKIFLIKNSMDSKEKLDTIEYEYELSKLKSRYRIKE